MINEALLLYTGRAERRWKQALKNPEIAQRNVLKRILRLQSTHPQLTSGNWQDWQENWQSLPLLTYEETGLPERSLTYQTPRCYETTSGSSGAKKQIPYTPALLQSFTEMFLIWTHDVLRFLKQRGTPFTGGQIYISVSPQFKDSAEGLADDSDYLTGFTGWLSQHYLAVPSSVRHLQHPQSFWDVVSLSLLRSPTLEIVSVWSPSFWRVLQRHMITHRERLVELLAQQELTYENQRFVLPVPPPVRCRELREALQALPETWAWRMCFPHLKFISCWGAENARADFRAICQDFPAVHVQEKGLLATEAPLTIPSEKYGGFLPLLHEVFFEFLPEMGNSPQRPLQLHELEEGAYYEVVISQKGGLLRYRLKDRVQVTGKYGKTPFLRFCGRSENVSDLVGEKLNAAYVVEGVQKLYPQHKLCLIPDGRAHDKNSEAGYVLLSKKPLNPDALEDYFCRAFHYGNARKLGQLRPLRHHAHPDIFEHLTRFFVEKRHMKRGDLKDQVLYTREHTGELLDYLAGSLGASF